MRSEARVEPTLVDILYAEDNPDDVELTLRALRKRHLAERVHVVPDGEACLDFLFARGPYAGRSRADPPKVVLLDIKMPKVDGIEVVRQLKGDPRTRVIPVVMLTSSREERDVAETYRLGVNSYIVKPVEFDEFIATVAHVGLYWGVLNQLPK